MKTACELQLRRVRTTGGVLLGRAFDFRCAWRGESLVVTHLVVGRRGLLERLGFREPRRDTVPWNAVVRVDDRTIVVEIEGGCAHKTTRRR
jgi:hypothetical protein